MVFYWGSIHTWVIIAAIQYHLKMVLKFRCWTILLPRAPKRVQIALKNHHVAQILPLLKMTHWRCIVSLLKHRYFLSVRVESLFGTQFSGHWYKFCLLTFVYFNRCSLLSFGSCFHWVLLYFCMPTLFLTLRTSGFQSLFLWYDNQTVCPVLCFWHS